MIALLFFIAGISFASYAEEEMIPMLDIIVEGNCGEDAWYIELPVIKIVTITDDEADIGVYYELRLDEKIISEGEVNDQIGPKISDSGIYTVNAYVIDENHERGEVVTKSIKVDLVTPEIKVSYDDVTIAREKQITIHTKTGVSGIRLVEVKEREDGVFTSAKIQKDKTGNFSFYAEEENGIYYFRITDQTGRISEVEEVTFTTIDRTKPQVSVIYNNNKAVNKMYFSHSRTAIITIVESNFNEAEVEISITANDKSGKVKKPVISNWESDGEIHTAKIKYTKEAEYTFDIIVKDLAGNKNTEVDYGKSKAPNRFTIDQTKPIATISNSYNNVLWSSLKEVVSFDLFTNQRITLNINGSDNLSGIKSVEYFITDSPVSKDELANKKDEWIFYLIGKSEIGISPNSQVIVYVKITDYAQNVTYICSGGIIADSIKPIGILTPKISLKAESGIEDIYNDDVKINIVVKDPQYIKVCSGIKSVIYSVYCEGILTYEEELYSYSKSVSGKKDLTHTYSTIRTVDASLNNSNHVEVKVTAVDNAGNSSTETLKLKIDVTPPVIEVVYQSKNNSKDERYFNSDRTATIIIKERNFDEQNVIITITNSNGTIPKISGFKEVTGSGNGDASTHIAVLNYTQDGDYSFKVSCTDLADNETSTGLDQFIIDKTAPIISVKYDNNNSKNSNYYSAGRTATITINEHNFDKGRVEIISNQSINEWISDGDIHSTSITFGDTGTYHIGVRYSDRAGNEGIEYEEEIFHIDMIRPVIEISGVKDKSANNERVVPIITCIDNNLEIDGMDVIVKGSVNGEVFYKYSRIHSLNRETFIYEDFAYDKKVDDVYTMYIQAIDKAGNITVKSIIFSVNRFGSTYDLTLLSNINGRYLKMVGDIIVSEINVTKIDLDTLKIKLFKDEEVLYLEPNRDFTVIEIRTDSLWYQYEYSIFSEHFVDDANYKIYISSVDHAGNKSENTLMNKQSNIQFSVDNTAPRILVFDLENDRTYNISRKEVGILVNDNIKLSKVMIDINGQATEYSDAAALEKLPIILEASDTAQSIKITAEDAAGNITEKVIENFYVTKNLWIRLYNNKPLFYCSIIVLNLIFIAIIIMIYHQFIDKSKSI